MVAVWAPPFIYGGAMVAKYFASWMEEMNIFVPDDDDDDDWRHHNLVCSDNIKLLVATICGDSYISQLHLIGHPVDNCCSSI